MTNTASTSPETPGLKIIFAGTPEFAAMHLQALLDSHHEVCAVYTQPDRKAGRGRKLQPGPVKTLALQHDIPVFQPLSLKGEEEQQAMAALNADLMVVVAYGLILPTAILNTPRLGCVNVHASLLPRWRGAAPIQRAIIAGDNETGICYMQMDKGLDTGDVLYTLRCPITASDTGHSLHDKLAQLGSEQLAEVLDKLNAGVLKPQAQDNGQSNYAPKLSKAEAQLDWNQSAQTLEHQVRAFNAWPVTFTHLDEDVVRVWQATALSQSYSPTATPGTVVSTSKESINIACAEGVLCLETLQFPGGKALSCEQILASKKERLTPGTTFTFKPLLKK
ncbi:MAG: methionyl-tRNA formyltransferase [Pseudomonadales bacterium]|nr:methionyl-tRNA formyltransferase [Pseudomonadales bacterium]